MTERLVDFLRLIRINNLIIIAGTQIFAYYFLTPSISLSHLVQPDFIKLIMSTFLVAAAGYIINDYMDVMLDLVNRPEKVVVGKSISRRWAMFLHLILNTIAFLLAYSVNKKIGLLVLACAFGLWIYSQLLKKTYLIGNLLVASLTAFTLWILLMYDDNIMKSGIWVYGIFAFGTTLLREIIKDTEDLRGDQKFKCRTLPIVLGIRKTKDVLFWIQITLIGLTLTFITTFTALSLSSNKIFVMFLMYMLMVVVLPMFVMAWLIKTADVKKDFSRLSLISKIVMISGIISMIFWRF
ncbi:MAG: geranylgeranylglycerol-phosphate geranylgeranyltransferase [Bacteroidia bacterium]|nr:geranylgeranylglycerol-phosphate geranylgeranyltransferase [Bacteroidia bacterium]MCF8426049.1 geranylgeranylglycerol-phosphate geranylgeranyltransferase [Bacteroidia bacterium]MCF8445356.1 geranylgeranylglycerol-phosphate geranylgeranyltransferase [Bacteroidia bacterium]